MMRYTYEPIHGWSTKDGVLIHVKVYHFERYLLLEVICLIESHMQGDETHGMGLHAWSNSIEMLVGWFDRDPRNLERIEGGNTDSAEGTPSIHQDSIDP